MNTLFQDGRTGPVAARHRNVFEPAVRPRRGRLAAGFAPDSPLEGDGFELSVPGREPVRGRRDSSLENESGSVAEPKVRIHLPPAESRMRTRMIANARPYFERSSMTRLPQSAMRVPR
jgi:hypothetical protein